MNLNIPLSETVWLLLTPSFLSSVPTCSLLSYSISGFSDCLLIDPRKPCFTSCADQPKLTGGHSVSACPPVYACCKTTLPIHLSPFAALRLRRASPQVPGGGEPGGCPCHSLSTCRLPLAGCMARLPARVTVTDPTGKPRGNKGSQKTQP